MVESALRPAMGWDTHVHVFDAAAPVLPGHYRPQSHSLAEIERLGSEHGLGRLVLVQPSVYGRDHRVLLEALRRQPGRHRGIAVLDASVSEAELDALHQAGVRGVRFNTVSPVGNSPEALSALAPRLRERGWHVQWYVRPAQLHALCGLQRATGLTFVLDHLAGMDLDASESAWQALAELASQGAWLKLSGWYRLGSSPPYMDMVPHIQRACALFGSRLVWGSDWPHTSLDAAPQSRHASLLAPLQEALGAAEAQAVLHTHAARLYGADLEWVAQLST